MYKFFFKRVIDFILAFLGLVILLPFLVIVTIFLAFANKGNVFFLQKRPGLNSMMFTIIKFKTMNDKIDRNGCLLPDGERLTPIGKFIRKTSLDEVLQLINVLKGDMSLVGPRPLLPQYLPLYNENQLRRHSVRPGITGWAQINGRNLLSWNEKFKLDVWYVDNISLWLDTKIVFFTFFRIFKPVGINALNSDTIEAFNGNN